MFKTDEFQYETMNRRFLHEFSSSSVSAFNAFMLGSNVTDQNMNTDPLFYDDGFEDDEDGTESDCSTSYGYSSDQDGLHGSENLFLTVHLPFEFFLMYKFLF